MLNMNRTQKNLFFLLTAVIFLILMISYYGVAIQPYSHDNAVVHDITLPPGGEAIISEDRAMETVVIVQHSQNLETVILHNDIPEYSTATTNNYNVSVESGTVSVQIKDMSGQMNHVIVTFEPAIDKGVNDQFFILLFSIMALLLVASVTYATILMFDEKEGRLRFVDPSVKVYLLDTDGKALAECPKCHNVIPAGAQLCPYCGTKFRSNLAKCGACGELIPENSLSCPHCGVKFVADKEEAET